MSAAQQPESVDPDITGCDGCGATRLETEQWHRLDNEHYCDTCYYSPATDDHDEHVNRQLGL